MKTTCTLREMNPVPGMPLYRDDSKYRYMVKEVHAHGCSMVVAPGQNESPHLHFVDFECPHFIKETP